MNFNEEWKPVLNYEDSYMVSNTGKVRSLPRYKSNGKGKVLINGKILSERDNGFGYKMVYLYKDGKAKNYKVHRLVAEAFIGVSDLQIDHINMNRADNNISNLRYVTARQNKRLSIDKSKTSSKHYGVTKNRKGYSACITVKGKQEYIGYYRTELEAASALDSYICKNTISI